MRALLVALLLVLGACAGGDDATTTAAPAESTTTAVPAPTTSPTTSTTAEPGTTTTTTTVAPSTIAAPDTNALADGSGCTPGSDELPDGEWFGYVVSATADTVDFDLACWFTGDAAVLAAAEDGDESPPPNDYHVRNENPMLRTVGVSPAVEVAAMTNVGDPATEGPMAFADWVAVRVDGPDPPMDVWIVVEDGLVVSITEQYRP